MKKLLLLVTALVALGVSAAAQEKAALLMVHFGTTYDETRGKTIDAINEKARASFPELTVREAYTSRIVIRKLKERGIEKLTPLEALIRLRADGFTRVIV
ncbi:MAG: sirohydrochlorin cobaltochelatase, partial [Bacteroidales bacterium]|nr:sirohydrochlorin cobaltochelatase [Bacteroidales bacterium]